MRGHCIVPVLVKWKNGTAFSLSVNLPPGMSAQVQIPANEHARGIFVNDQPARSHRDGQWWVLDQDAGGAALIEAR